MPSPIISPEKLAAATGMRLDRAAFWSQYLNWPLEKGSIDTPLRLAAFLAQVAHESGGFTIMVESLRYTPQRLRQVFPRHFPTDQLAAAYALNEAKIGDRVYGGRMGNGPEGSGDGFRYRGRGLIQLTGKDNYRAASRALGQDFLANPALLETPRWACEAAGWFWTSRDLNTLADKGLFAEITRRINGGTNGQSERQRLYDQALRALGQA